MLVSSIQQSDSVIYIYIYIYRKISHLRLFIAWGNDTIYIQKLGNSEFKTNLLNKDILFYCCFF